MRSYDPGQSVRSCPHTCQSAASPPAILLEQAGNLDPPYVVLLRGGGNRPPSSAPCRRSLGSQWRRPPAEPRGRQISQGGGPSGSRGQVRDGLRSVSTPRRHLRIADHPEPAVPSTRRNAGFSFRHHKACNLRPSRTSDGCTCGKMSRPFGAPESMWDDEDDSLLGKQDPPLTVLRLTIRRSDIRTSSQRIVSKAFARFAEARTMGRPLAIGVGDPARSNGRLRFVHDHKERNCLLPEPAHDGFLRSDPRRFRRTTPKPCSRSSPIRQACVPALCPGSPSIVQSRRIQKNYWPKREIQRTFPPDRGHSRRIGYDGHGLWQPTR